jgi:hypothetical protein
MMIVAAMKRGDHDGGVLLVVMVEVHVTCVKRSMNEAQLLLHLISVIPVTPSSEETLHWHTLCRARALTPELFSGLGSISREARVYSTGLTLHEIRRREQ